MKGFTLIELMVSVSIGLVVTGMVIVNYNSYNSTQTLKQAALTLKNDIRLIQTKAASGEKPSGCQTLTGWSMTFVEKSYSYQANCDSILTGSSTTIPLPTGVTMTSFPSVNPVTFYVLARGTNLPASTTIILSGLDKQYAMRIGNNGDISDVGIQ